MQLIRFALAVVLLLVPALGGAETAPTFYVGGPGSTDDDAPRPSTPFATIQAAHSYIRANVNWQLGNVRVLLSPGPPLVQNPYLGGIVRGGTQHLLIECSTGIASDCIVDGSWTLIDGGYVWVRNITVTSAGHIFNCAQGSEFDISNVTVTSAGGAVFHALLGGMCNLISSGVGGGPLTLAGNIGYLAYAEDIGSSVNLLNTVSLSNNVVVSGETIRAITGGQVNTAFATYVLNGHTVTGTRWLASNGGTIITFADNCNSLIPGSAPGSATAFGWCGLPTTTGVALDLTGALRVGGTAPVRASTTYLYQANATTGGVAVLGPDNLTNGLVVIYSQRADGSNPIAVLSFDGTGNPRFGGIVNAQSNSKAACFDVHGVLFRSTTATCPE